MLLPGDPGRALLLAQALLDEPKMFNHNRGLWGYSGAAADGEALTIQSTGMGGPSAAIVVTELADLGAEQLIRVGTCGALDGSLALGDLLIATEALTGDGTSRALGADRRVAASPGLAEALTRAAGDADARPGVVVSTDLFYEQRADAEREWLEAGAIAVEMETATLFALADTLDVQTASLLVVSDVILPVRRRISSEALRAAEHRMGDVAARALAARG